MSRVPGNEHPYLQHCTFSLNSVQCLNSLGFFILSSCPRTHILSIIQSTKLVGSPKSLNFLIKGVRTAWRNQLYRNLKELWILFCQKSPSNALARSFVENNYKDLKTLNPKLPILIRECSGIEPQMWARYDMSDERGILLEGFSEPHILKALEDLAKAGASTKA